MVSNHADWSAQGLRFLEGRTEGWRLQVWRSDHQLSRWQTRRRRPVHLVAERQPGSLGASSIGALEVSVSATRWSSRRRRTMSDTGVRHEKYEQLLKQAQA